MSIIRESNRLYVLAPLAPLTDVNISYAASGLLARLFASAELKEHWDESELVRPSCSEADLEVLFTELIEAGYITTGEATGKAYFQREGR